MDLDVWTGLMLTTTTFIIAFTVSYVNLVKLFESCVASHNRVFNTLILFPSRDLGWWGQRNFAGRPLGDFLTLLIAILVRPPVTRKYFYYC